MTPLQELQLQLSIIKDILTSLSAITAAIIAVLGLQAWRRQLRGKTEYELAQKLLRAVYRARNALEAARIPTVGQREILEAMKAQGIDIDPNLDDEKTFTAGLRALYDVKWSRVKEAFVELEALTWEAEAHWGSRVHNYLNPLRDCSNTIAITLGTYLDKKEQLQDHIRDNAKAYDPQKTRQIIFSRPTDTDNFFSKEIDDAVTKAEDFLKPHLKI